MPTSNPRALIFSGFGLNCEEETKVAFERAGASADIVHIEDIARTPKLLAKYQIAAFPGGFSYGDDTGSGKAYGARVRHHLGAELEQFLERDTLMIGICNGFQILTASGILPGALVANDSARFTCRWVDLEVTSASPWLTGLTTLSLPIAHGEGKYVDSQKNLDTLTKAGGLALTYTKGEMTAYQGLPYNPNGSSLDIAGITNREGRVFGLMPHPERGAFFDQRPDWTVQREAYERAGKKLPEEAVGIEIFKNAVRYFS